MIRIFIITIDQGNDAKEAMETKGKVITKPVECKECGKVFKWGRNLLAHVQLMHQREVRYRCKICPLTFLRRKSYIKHHRSKHSEAPETWCKVSRDFNPILYNRYSICFYPNGTSDTDNERNEANLLETILVMTSTIS